MKKLSVCIVAILALGAISISCNSQGSCTGLAACDGDAGTVPPDDSGSRDDDGGDGGEIVGDVPIGEFCKSAWDCVAGAACLDQGGTMTCYEVCTDKCEVGVCTDTELGFKVCVAAEGP